MTLEQLLECSADQLEKMTDQELLEHFKPFLNVTRPELAEKPVKNSYSNEPPMTEKKKRGLELLVAAGVDISFAHKRRRRM